MNLKQIKEKYSIQYFRFKKFLNKSMKQNFFLLNSFDVEIFKLLWHNNKHSYRKLSGTINFAI